MAQQKALFLLGLKGAIEVQTIDIPKPGPGDVLVQVM
jgi:D-arabinose 1-dehydrogenase-like Zn-dependent alcohol dehydrogenase